MRFELGNGKVVTGFEALKAWAAVSLMWLLAIALAVGIFFLKSYRWGN